MMVLPRTDPEHIPLHIKVCAPGFIPTVSERIIILPQDPGKPNHPSVNQFRVYLKGKCLGTYTMAEIHTKYCIHKDSVNGAIKRKGKTREGFSFEKAGKTGDNK